MGARRMQFSHPLVYPLYLNKGNCGIYSHPGVFFPAEDTCLAGNTSLHDMCNGGHAFLGLQYITMMVMDPLIDIHDNGFSLEDSDHGYNYFMHYQRRLAPELPPMDELSKPISHPSRLCPTLSMVFFFPRTKYIFLGGCHILWHNLK